MDRFTPKAEVERSAKIFFTLVMILVAFGLVMVYSSSAVKSARGDQGEAHLLLVQLVKIAAAITGMLVMMKIDYRIFARHYVKILLAIVAVLLLVLVPIRGFSGEINGSSRWFRLGDFMVQPSEFAKLGLVIVLASLIIRSGDNIRSFFKGFCPAALAAALVCLPILVEPDFGTCTLTAAIAVILLFVGGARILHFVMAVFILAPLLFLFAYSSMNHVRERIEGFIQGSESGQVAAGLTALGSGGLYGSGLGGGASKLYYVPLCESDFIFSVIGEELGFLGTSCVILVFVLLVYFGIKVLLGIRNRYGFILALGVLLLISTQALTNIAVVLRVAPAKGIALPFVSSGGSSLMMLMMSVGLFIRIARHPDLPAPRFREEYVSTLFRRVISGILSGDTANTKRRG